MTSRQRELYHRLRSRARRPHTRLVGRWQPPQRTPEVEPSPAPRLGRAPEVAPETTHLGPVMDQAVLRAKRRMRIGADPDYDLLYENFDVLHYCSHRICSSNPSSTLLNTSSRTASPAG